MTIRRLAPLVILLCIALGGPRAALAGPWPREVGTVFLATSFGFEKARGNRTGFAEAYGEMGWRGGLVPALRLRLDSPLAQEGRGDGAADVRLRWHPQALPWGLALGLEGGLLLDSGARRGDDTLGTTRFRLVAVHLGRGIGTPLGDGWMRLTLSSEDPVRSEGEARREIMGQVGLRGAGGWLGLVSLSGFREGGETTVKLRPAIGRSFGPDRDVVLESVVERGGAGTRGLSLSLWQRF
ncbi:hypothetical protein [Rhodobaculum claviforme]|uniref:Uncharacterized protein n=1 Tax=Rhodobaculum claviforme TaxID=1549854 RepID=A0A934WHW6_9RHOB|nr:hypothetical protein [Rhodobaculum claviforme]MBK5925948.1 hypothetical protein [Rhodobaculum claviforme]